MLKIKGGYVFGVIPTPPPPPQENPSMLWVQTGLIYSNQSYALGADWTDLLQSVICSGCRLD